ncbi:hypothetical protein MRB53_003322 [Persea americana]|uniref:Uncharacterized protein n=1 Tax=Persea americana TaxID=3435 RepID=A0ACC2MX52_PERAE|nr:hypothetical protein MRB53_003322 [Persea americana]|eukprot:TRINITY_DN17421_c0_g1_i1.p1 TRINITY_DN17421_c0_g1~~TRINITY_DN17421_c0_g1_i1.p1  ORF type:complete len:338 (+),score=35.51 TRINITY_DN17421_c0_g1_i1:38-1015(+)
MGNLKNVAIAFLVPLPSIAFYLSFLHHSHQENQSPSHAPPLHFFKWCSHHPLLLANLLFFFNVNVLFWVIGLIQSNHWLIDLYWTVIPVMLVHYYASHPMARSDVVRSTAVVVLTWVWSIRLTHNYFRREKWIWGAREDWRFNDMRKEYGKNWWWISFFAVYLSQQVFLVGICLPMYAVHSSEKQWNAWDFVAMTICISGIVIAYFADTQLHSFVERNNMLKKIGVPSVPNLDKGVWRYSRHPNYFGEQLWWWGLVIFGWNVGQGWTFIGSLVNSMCLVYVTVLVEQRMLKQENRAKEYKLYQKTTSVWIPWFKSIPRGEKGKDT